MLEWIFGASKSLEMLFLLGGALSIPFSYLAPDGIVLLYPTLFAVIAPCFCITMVFIIIRALLSKLNVFMLIITGAAFTLFSLSLCGAVQSALLSGADYYINTLIFRGIKLSLIAPILYGAIAFGIIFCKKKNEKLSKTENFASIKKLEITKHI